MVFELFCDWQALSPDLRNSNSKFECKRPILVYEGLQVRFDLSWLPREEGIGQPRGNLRIGLTYIGLIYFPSLICVADAA
jgi:hypothetical protein